MLEILHWMIWNYHLGEYRNKLCAQTKRVCFRFTLLQIISLTLLLTPRVKCSSEQDIQWVKDPLDKLVDRNPRSNGCMTLKEVDDMKKPIINAVVSQTLTTGDSTFSRQQKILQAISNQCKDKQAEEFVIQRLLQLFEDVVAMNNEGQSSNARSGLASLPAVETKSTYIRKKGSIGTSYQIQ